MQTLNKRRRQIDLVSFITIAITVALFAVAVFVKGFTHELLLEVGVLLVSAKLIISSYQSKVLTKSLEQKLDNLTALIENQKR